MPRKLRLEYPGAIYHILSRGDRRENIFVDDQDRESFVQTLGDACAKTGWQVHAFCLMPNHFHLVVETPKANLVAGMKWFLGTYTMRFNRRHKISGHLFSGRYKSLVVDGIGSGYLRTVCDYVHLNPVRARLVREGGLTDYRWSSYQDYTKAPAARVAWLRTDRLLGEMRIPADSPAGRREFQQQMEMRSREEHPEAWEKVRRGWCLGEEAFRKELLKQMDERLGENHSAAERQENAEEKANRIVLDELVALGWGETHLSQRPKGDLEKIRIAHRLRSETTVTVKWIADRLGMGAWSYASSLLSRSKATQPQPRLTRSPIVTPTVVPSEEATENKEAVLWD